MNLAAPLITAKVALATLRMELSDPGVQQVGVVVKPDHVKRKRLLLVLHAETSWHLPEVRPTIPSARLAPRWQRGLAWLAQPVDERVGGDVVIGRSTTGTGRRCG